MFFLFDPLYIIAGCVKKDVVILIVLLSSFFVDILTIDFTALMDIRPQMGMYTVFTDVTNNNILIFS